MATIITMLTGNVNFPITEPPMATVQAKSDVYPNPAKGWFKLKTGPGFSNARISISNATGQQVYAHTLRNTTELEVNLDAAAGLYFMDVLSPEGGKTSYKIINE
ncbi:MAG: T9SS type A sorting domain-containing protein [Bacteroidia bacterium]